MVDQRDGDDENVLLRFPLRAPESTSPEHVVQIQIDPAVAGNLPEVLAMFRVLNTEASDDISLTPPLSRLTAMLRELRAVRVDWSFDFRSNNIASFLTPAEVTRRQSFLDVTFPLDVDLRRAATTLLSLPLVLQAVPQPAEAPPWTYVDEPLLGRDDQDLCRQWYVFRVRADRAWQMSTGRDVVIADVDFGFLTTHQDLSNIDSTKQYNAHDGSCNVSSGTHISHGTAVLGLAAGAQNRAGIVGVAYDSTLWPIQANAGDGPRIPGDKWARGIDYVRATSSDGRPKVAILEVQTKRGRCYEMVPSTREAIQQAIAHGLVVIVAAGNGGADVSLDDDDKEYPESGSILVGATAFHRHHNPRACSSNFGDRITVSAPGYGPADVTCSHIADDEYRLGFGGTSGAAPKVAGACALLLQLNPGLSHHDVKRILEMSGDEVLTCPNRPAGVFLNVEAAVKLAL